MRVHHKFKIAQKLKWNENEVSCFYCRYGDRTPLSNPARLVAIVWTLTGVIIIGILVGFIAVSLTSVSVGVDYKLYGAKASFYFSCSLVAK